MPLDFVDIDHVLLRVEFLDAAKDTFERLGFTVTPIRSQVDQQSWAAATGEAEERAGRATINQRQILFDPPPGRDDVANYLAIIAVEDQLATPPEVTQMVSYLQDTEGPRAIILHTKDVEAARESLEAQGIRTYAPVRFDTGWHDAERDVFVPISSSAALPIHGQVPFMVDPYETRTLDGYTYAPWTAHANGARHIAGVSGITRNVRRDAELMAERIFGTEVVYESEEVAVLRRRDLFLRIVSPAGFAEVYPNLDHSTERVMPHTFAVTIAVESLDRVTSLLEERGVPWARSRDGVAVPRRHAHNTLVEFVETTT